MLKRLPANLLDALRRLEADSILSERLGVAFVEAYLKLKYRQWNEYSSEISPWESEHTLDC
jgi:glutamine synthetase